MRILLVVLLMLLAAPAMADDTICSDEQRNALTLAHWWIHISLDDQISIGLILETPESNEIVMIDADITFSDALSRYIGTPNLLLPPDIDPEAHPSERNGYILQSTMLEGNPDFSRLIDLNENLVTATLCTRAVLFQDGTKMEFD